MVPIWVPRIDMLNEITLIGFDDNVALIVTVKTEETPMHSASTELDDVSSLMRSKHLDLAPEKSEVVFLTPKRKMGVVQFDIYIKPKAAIKYHGVWIDTNFTFSAYVSKLEDNDLKTSSALGRIMPNILGPISTKRRLLSGVEHLQIDVTTLIGRYQ